MSLSYGRVWGKEDTWTLTTSILIPVGKVIQYILWEVRNNHRQTFPYTEVDNWYQSFVIFNFFISWWPDRFAYASAQSGHSRASLPHS